MEYVTFDTDGRLTGGYSQDLHPTHAPAHIEVTAEQRAHWTTYQANAARDGLEPAAATMPVIALAEAVPMLNLQLILIDDGKLATVETIIDGMEGDDGKRARAYWAKAQTARRDNYLVEQLWPVIGYDLAGFNAAWARAAALDP